MRDRTLATLVGCLALLSGCEQAAQPAASEVAADKPAASGTASSPAAAALAEAVAFANRVRTDRDAVLREIGRLEYAVHRKLLIVSGLEAELGGAEAADRALRDLMLDIKRLSSAYEPARWIKLQTPGADDGYLGVASTAVELTGIGLGLGELYDNVKGVNYQHGDENGSSQMQFQDGTLEYNHTVESKSGELLGKIQTHLKVNVCPDAAGNITVEASSTSAMTRPAGRSGANSTVKVEITRSLDDNAEFTDDIDSQAHVEHATFGANAGTFVDLNITNADGDRRVNRRSSQATDSDVYNAEVIAAVLLRSAVLLTEHTRKVWEHGKCVKLEPTTTPSKRTKAKPSTSFNVLAAPRSSVDGSSVGGTVKATLSGDSSLDPAGTKVRSDAKFTYVAPNEKKKQASVSFEARSRRGVGKAELAFDTNEGAAYSAAGGAGDFHGTGEICDLSAPFTISGGGNVVTFTPSSASGGKYTYAGNMSGFSISGHGTYTVKYADDIAVSIAATGPGSVKTAAGTYSATDSEHYVLTPNESGCGTE